MSQISPTPKYHHHLPNHNNEKSYRSAHNNANNELLRFPYVSRLPINFVLQKDYVHDSSLFLPVDSF